MPNIRKKLTKTRKREGAAKEQKKPLSQAKINPLAKQKVAKTARGRRELKKREPKVVENPKTTLIVRGQRTKEHVGFFSNTS